MGEITSNVRGVNEIGMETSKGSRNCNLATSIGVKSNFEDRERKRSRNENGN